MPFSFLSVMKTSVLLVNSVNYLNSEKYSLLSFKWNGSDKTGNFSSVFELRQDVSSSMNKVHQTIVQSVTLHLLIVTSFP